MTDRDECRVPTCTRLARERYAGRFCSKRCDVRYEHLQADARDAAQGDVIRGSARTESHR
ncbi:hypothetical protein FEJ81_22230 (plasmid) [Natrinema versiforme]|uniref:Uncharacterized protein n=1 Tax=Natrinema versiforme TaxID=88724 RepID=A0A4P8WSG4_9EURY|nr:hypothetical protein FEJ81_22230 [Natrinema versiforme]